MSDTKKLKVEMGRATVFKLFFMIDAFCAGKKGWSTPSRRSISWLLYLCEPGWDVAVNGGALRSFPQHLPVIGATGANDGDLQIGWLKVTDKNNSTKDGPRVNISVVDAVKPVFLDCWRRNSAGIVKSALYIRSSTSRQGRQYVSSGESIVVDLNGSSCRQNDGLRQLTIFYIF